MKSRIVSVSVAALGLAVIGLVLLAGRIQSQTNPPAATDAATNNPPSPDSTPLPPAPTTVPETPQPSPSLAPAPAAAVIPSDVKLSKGAADIARFAQAGIGEDVMLAYVDNANARFNLGSDQIVYLNDLGVSGNVVKTMITRDAQLDAMAQAYAASIAAASQPQPAPPQQPLAPYPPIPTDNSTSPPAPPTDDSSAQMPPDDSNAYASGDDAGYFYDSLQPYGSWVYAAGVGVCWQPTVWLGNHDWRPYCDHGRWIYSNCGWYWQSDYSWGWAAFHYGRWFDDPVRGWLWCPDRVWGPAWVAWRASAQYCGWAPLPPSAHFVSGKGFVPTHPYNVNGLEFDLKPKQYTFIPIARMNDYAPARYKVDSGAANQILAQTKVVSQFTEQNNHLVVRGVDPNMVAAQDGGAVRQAEIRETPSNGDRRVQPDRLSKSGGNLVIYRPELPTPNPLLRTGNGAAPGPRSLAPAPRNLGQPRAGADPVPVASATGPYPAGSLVLHGNEQAPPLPNMNLSYLAHRTQTPGAPQASVQPNYTYAPAQPNNGWNGSQPAASQSEYTVVNGFARPIDATPVQNAGPSIYTIPGNYTAAQRGGGPSAGYGVYSTGTPAPQRENQGNGNTPYVIPGHFTAADSMKAFSTHERPAEASPQPHNEPAPAVHQPEPHASYSAPEPSHSSAPAPSSSGRR